MCPALRCGLVPGSLVGEWPGCRLVPNAGSLLWSKLCVPGFWFEKIFAFLVVPAPWLLPLVPRPLLSARRLLPALRSSAVCAVCLPAPLPCAGAPSALLARACLLAVRCLRRCASLPCFFLVFDFWVCAACLPVAVRGGRAAAWRRRALVFEKIFFAFCSCFRALNFAFALRFAF